MKARRAVDADVHTLTAAVDMDDDGRGGRPAGGEYDEAEHGQNATQAAHDKPSQPFK